MSLIKQVLQLKQLGESTPGILFCRLPNYKQLFMVIQQIVETNTSHLTFACKVLIYKLI